MEASIRLGRIFGIPFGINSSWFLIFGLVTWSLAVGYFPNEYSGLPGGAYWLLGALTSLLFFGSVLTHELAHSLVARREGIPVKSINLFIFGGVAQITREPKTAGAEFRITIAGPLASLALSGLFFVIYMLDQPIPYVAAPSLYLARLNLILAFFNMIPGFPLDGGRVLRALVWKATGDLQKATQVATTSGQLVAFGFMAVGVFSLLQGQIFNGLWLIFIGWFLQNAAVSAMSQSNIEHRLAGVTVEQAMTRDCNYVPADMNLNELVNQHVLSGAKRCFFVTDEGRLRGLLTLRDVAQVARERWPQVTAEQSMVPVEKLVKVSPQTPLLTALQLMDEARVAQIPVMDQDAIVGMLSRENVLHYLRVRTELGL